MSCYLPGTRLVDTALPTSPGDTSFVTGPGVSKDFASKLHLSKIVRGHFKVTQSYELGMLTEPYQTMVTQSLPIPWMMTWKFC